MTASPLELTADPVDLLQALVDIESVSGDEKNITDAIETALRRLDHLEVIRHENVVVARTDLGRAERVVIAGHTDTVPLTDPPNLPSRVEGSGDQRRIVGRGTCDMKGGVAVQLSVAAEVTEPTRDVTWIFYDNEEVEADKNGLRRLAAEHPELLAGDFAVLCEPTAARLEGGCQGTMRVRVHFRGRTAHSGRGWLGHDAIHEAGPLLARLQEFTAEQPWVDGLQFHEGINAVRIGGGIAGNVIPDHCWVDINYRFAPDKDLAAAEAYLVGVLGEVEYEVTDAAPGARPGLDRPAAAEFAEVIGGEPGPKFGWTDVARFAELGIPAVNYGPADPIKAHTDDEFCPAADVYACRDALRRWLRGTR